jgi:hypothetical protein
MLTAYIIIVFFSRTTNIDPPIAPYTLRQDMGNALSVAVQTHGIAHLIHEFSWFFVIILLFRK